MSLLLQKLTNSILTNYSEIERDVIHRLKEFGNKIEVENLQTYIEGHDQVGILSAALTEEGAVSLHLSDNSSIGLDCLDGLQLLRVYDYIVFA
jgi:hypothetical protein